MKLHAVHTVSSLRGDHGGPGRSITGLCSALVPHLEVELIAFGPATSEEPPVLPTSERVKVRLLPNEVHVLEVLTKGRQLRRAVEEATQQKVKAAIIHDHGVWLRTNHATAIAAQRAGMPRVVSPRGMISKWAMDYHRARKRVAWWLYQSRDLRAAELLHATSQQEAEDARRLALRMPIAVIPNGVEVPEIVMPRRRHTPERRALFLSRIHPIKGVLELISAWSRVRPANWSLVVAGPDDGGHRRVAEDLVRREQLNDNVKFIGSVPNEQKWLLYSEADLFILPTFSENFGIVIAEALGAGLPVITTTGAPWRVLGERQLGWSIDIGVEPLVAAIRQATSLNDEARCRLGERGRTYVEAEFSWRHIGERMAAAYRWLCGVGPQSSDIQLN